MKTNTKKQKEPRKTAKKAPAKQKLIEGLYSHKFLTRLHPSEGEDLEELKKLFGEKTLNGTIKSLINNYKLLRHKWNLDSAELGTLKIQVEEQTERLTNLRESLIEILKPVTHAKANSKNG